MRSHENLRNVLAAVTGKSFYVRHSPTGTGKKNQGQNVSPRQQ
jgi:hypothetical protein